MRIIRLKSYKALVIVTNINCRRRRAVERILYRISRFTEQRK